jgi:hypothetical protein
VRKVKIALRIVEVTTMEFNMTYKGAANALQGSYKCRDVE